MSREMPEDQKNKCSVIIHGAATAAGATGAGVAQIPLADSALITPIQVGMIIALGKVFDQEIVESTARAIISGAGAALAGRTASQFLLGWIPGLGNVINTATAAGLTEAIGWSAANKFFEEQTSLLSLLYNDSEGEIDDQKDNNEEGTADMQIGNNNAPIKRAEEFFTGKKTIEKNEEEYEALICDIEEMIERGEDTDDGQLANVYQKLVNKNFSQSVTSDKTLENVVYNAHRYDLDVYGAFATDTPCQYRVLAEAVYRDICVGDKYVLVNKAGEKTNIVITVLEIGTSKQESRKPKVSGMLILEANTTNPSVLRYKKFVLQSRAGEGETDEVLEPNVLEVCEVIPTETSYQYRVIVKAQSNDIRIGDKYAIVINEEVKPYVTMSVIQIAERELDEAKILIVKSSVMPRQMVNQKFVLQRRTVIGAE